MPTKVNLHLAENPEENQIAHRESDPFETALNSKSDTESLLPYNLSVPAKQPRTSNVPNEPIATTSNKTKKSSKQDEKKSMKQDGKTSVKLDRIKTMKRRIRKKSTIETAIIHLPTIEDFIKPIIFTAEGPSRVIERIERFMGSDKVKYFDREYMGVFSAKLEKEDAQKLKLRSVKRVEFEKDRSRKLALNGLMEPTASLQDIYKHPLFKINNILKRVKHFGNNMLISHKQMKIPPINPVEPFENDESGMSFKTYPGHEGFGFGENEEEGLDLEDLHFIYKQFLDESSEYNLAQSSEEEDVEDLELEGEIEEENNEILDQVKSIDLMAQDSLKKILEKYNIPSEVNVNDPYQSELLNSLYFDENTALDMFEKAFDVSETFKRQCLKADQACRELVRLAAKYEAGNSRKSSQETTPDKKLCVLPPS